MSEIGKVMIENLKGIKVCEICGSGLVLDTQSTLNSYTDEIMSSVSDISVKVDDIVGRYLIYSCYNCGFSCKLTYKSIYDLIRKSLTKSILLGVVGGYIKPSSISDCKFYIYCGKCSGFDGSGSCTKKIYEECDIKRFPTHGL